MATIIPHINLLVLDEMYSKAFENALRQYKIQDQITYTIHEASLSQLSADVRSDLIVSPANSYAILDGGFDDAISRALSLKTDYCALMRACQSVLYDRYRGFQPPGSCAVIEIPPELLVEGATKNVWGIKFIGHCPTMRKPSDCRWDREVVYECIWCLLCEIDKHNNAVDAGEHSKEKRINSILMTPMATGTGFVSAEKWAGQLALAIKHYIFAIEEPDLQSTMNWPEAGRMALEVQKTHRL